MEYGLDGNANIARVTWTGLLNGDTGAPVLMGDWADRTVHISGNFGVGGSVNIEGSNMRTTETPFYVVLTDPQGNAVTKTVEAMEVLSEVPLLTRPNVTAGDGATSLTVRMLARRNR